MSIRNILENLINDYPICEYCFGTTDQIPFSEKVRYICENECSRCNHCWACPPYVGSVHDNMKKCLQYPHFFLFSTVNPVTDAWNTEECLMAKKDHEAVTRDIRKRLYEETGLPMTAPEDADLNGKPAPFLVLSTGCAICDVCASPDEPCRHPEERLNSMESHGIVIFSLAESMEMCYNYGNDSATYFSMVLYN